MTNTWKPLKGIVDCGDNYEISDTGLVRHIRFDRILSAAIPKSKKNYPKVTLSHKGKQKVYLLHRLLALTFIDNPDNKPEVNHKDGNKHNFSLDNLEWSTYSENAQHAFDTGLNPHILNPVIHQPPDNPEQYIPINQHNKKLTEDDVRQIRELYKTGKYSHRILSNMFKTGKRNITQILTYKTWKHVV
ncbi:putative HNH endonuclease [Bacillus phage vB_BcgM]|nr:putative HNH endonuclease [Bacillus phage vB_BcgM]